MAAQDAGEWYKPVELARACGVDRTTIWKWFKRGLLERRSTGPRTGVQLRPASWIPRAWLMEEFGAPGPTSPPTRTHQGAARARRDRR